MCYSEYYIARQEVARPQSGRRNLVNGLVWLILKREPLEKPAAYYAD